MMAVGCSSNASSHRAAAISTGCARSVLQPSKHTQKPLEDTTEESTSAQKSHQSRAAHRFTTQPKFHTSPASVEILTPVQSRFCPFRPKAPLCLARVLSISPQCRQSFQTYNTLHLALQVFPSRLGLKGTTSIKKAQGVS